MKTVPVSIKELDDILRERLDQCATVNPHIKISKKLLEDWMAEKEISTDEEKEINAYLRSRFLKIFLDAKETLIIPDDTAHKIIIEGIPDIFDDLQIRFAYQDFYAYQFVDKLQDIVRRALMIQKVFVKKTISESVKKVCREAYLTFIHGYHTASIALCRSIIESMLKSRLNIDIGGLQKLNEIGLERNYYPKRIWHKINQVRKDGNRFIHEINIDKIPSESDNLKILGYTQDILQMLTDLDK